MRFAFGKNWQSFLTVLDDRRIEEACTALRISLGREDLTDWRVLDVGSGSGLSSLALRKLGAHVLSFDYDPDSVACTKELRKRFDADNTKWQVLRGSVLDKDFMAGLGHFDLVYAWGVLHHTGAMWDAIELSQQRVAAGGTLLVALYNDQGFRSRAWLHIKRLYCSGTLPRLLVQAAFYPMFAAYTLMLDIRNLEIPGEHMRNYHRRRGMSIVHDWRDWLGGYPFEVASPKEVQTRLERNGYALKRAALTSGWGCNELVLRRAGGSD